MKKTSLFPTLMLFTIISLTVMVLNSCSPKGKNLGLQLYSIRDSINRDIPGALAKVAAMGYKFVEPADYKDGKFYGMEPAAFRALLEKNYLYMLSSHVNHAAPDSTNYDETMAWWDKCIDAHIAAGAKFIVQPSMANSAYQSVEGLQTYCDYFNEVGAKCNAKGIRFGYHNHDREFNTKLDSTIVIYDYMLEHTDPVKVMFQVDLGHMVDGGADPVYYFNKYPGRFELWHIAEGYELGSTGKMDYQAIWAAAGKAGLRYGIVEVEKYNYDEFTSCKLSYDFLNNADYVVMPH
jgi:sugar phosphate isomerase/epimerase